MSQKLILLKQSFKVMIAISFKEIHLLNKQE